MIEVDGKTITFQEFFDSSSKEQIDKIFGGVKSLTKKGNAEKWVSATKLYFGAGMTYVEIASKYNVSTQRARVMVHRCLDQIEENLTRGAYEKK